MVALPTMDFLRCRIRKCKYFQELPINDLPEAIKSRVFLFADDLKMIANPYKKNIVENDLISLENWENTQGF